MMKKILGIAALIMILWVSTAAEIRFSPDSGNIGKGCLVTADIIVNTDSRDIAATDIMIESSLDFVDFVPTKMFPYFLPPQVKDSMIHIVGFTIDPKHRVKGKWSIGTLYLKQKGYDDSDGTIKLYFKKKWDTTDSNLSVAGGIDILDTVGTAYYQFTDSGACAHYAGEAINWWIANASLNSVITKINRNQRMQKIFNRKTLIAFAWLLIVITFLFLYYKNTKQWKKR